MNLRSFTTKTLDERKEFLDNSLNEYDKNKIANLSENEINALMIAEKATTSQLLAQQKVNKLDQEKADLEKQKEKELKDAIGIEANSLQKSEWTNLWVSIPSVKDFHTYYDKDDSGTSKIDRKREYFEDAKKGAEKAAAEYKAIIDDPLSFEDDIESAKKTLSYVEDTISICDKRLAALDDFEQTGLKYLNLKEQLDLKYLPQFEQLESEIGEAKKEQDILNTPEFNQFVNQARDLISKYQDETAIYSQARKNNATWITEAWAKAHGYKSGNLQEVSVKHFGSRFQKMWNNMTSSEQSQLINYTGSGYSKYNRPLRGLPHSGWYGYGFANAVTQLTNAIDKCTWDEDIWVQRGVPADTPIFELAGKKGKLAINDLTDGEIQALVGTSFTDNGFFSSGAAKGTGMVKSLIINTYCPKGTKMAYMNTKGAYTNTDENEMILQRGYTYRITKVEKKGSNKFYIDVEVILGSDDNKITDIDKLKEIGNKYLI